MTRVYTRLLTRRETGGDRVAAVDNLTANVGRLLVHALEQTPLPMVTGMPTGSLTTVWGASTTSPMALRSIKVSNPTAGSVNISFAIMSSSGGSPGAGNSFLAWATPLAAYSMFEWSGYVVFPGRYLYALASASGLGLYMWWEYITPG